MHSMAQIVEYMQYKQRFFVFVFVFLFCFVFFCLFVCFFVFWGGGRNAYFEIDAIANYIESMIDTRQSYYNTDD